MFIFYMKGSAALLPNKNHNLVIVNEDAYQQPYNHCEDLLTGLGFEEGELEMFFDMNQVSENELVERYIQRARSAPYNLNWQTGDDACIADNMLGVFKDNGVEYTKHDIVEDVFDSFSEQAAPQRAGRRQKSRRSTKKRINKKKRGTRRKHRRSKK
jgi:hypothetical protein